MTSEVEQKAKTYLEIQDMLNLNRGHSKDWKPIFDQEWVPKELAQKLVDDVWNKWHEECTRCRDKSQGTVAIKKVNEALKILGEFERISFTEDVVPWVKRLCVALKGEHS